MGVTTLEKTVTLKIMECGTCGVAFAMPQTIYETASKEGGWFYCPLGHCRGWKKQDAKNAADELRDEIAKLQSNIAYKNNQIESQKREVESQKQQIISAKRAKTKLENRIKNGVCPCCQRSFVNVQKHIATKHPEFTKENR